MIVSQSTRLNASGGWPRFSSYVVLEGQPGGVIAPAEHASLGWYDPWELGLEPLNELSRMTRKLRLRAEREGSYRLTALDARDLTEWCAAHGLLGLLPAKLVRLTVAGRATYTRIGQTWREEPHSIEPRRSRTAAAGDPAGALLRGRDGLPEFHAGDDQALWRYFPATYALRPRARAAFAYPQPDSEQFWHSYGEPVGDFVIEVQALMDGLQNLMCTTAGVNGSALRPILGQLIVNELAAQVSPALFYSDETMLAPDRLRAGWDGASLLGHLAAMSVYQLAAGTPVRPCAHCGGSFLVLRAKRLHCSERCRLAAAQAAARKKHAKEDV